MAVAEQNGGRLAGSVRPGLPEALPGLLVVVTLGAVATGLGHLAPVVGAPVIAVLLGLAARLVFNPGAWAARGLAVGRGHRCNWQSFCSGPGSASGPCCGLARAPCP